MAKIELIKCDNCGKQKEQSNHWWKIEYKIMTKSMFIYPSEEKINIHKNDINRIYLGAQELDSCGLECLGILESKIKEGVNPLK
jgi:hypothetical protein